jgi:hypothetical protein
MSGADPAQTDETAEAPAEPPPLEADHEDDERTDEEESGWVPL